MKGITMPSIVQQIMPHNTDNAGDFHSNQVSDIYRYDCDRDKYRWTAYVGSNTNAPGNQCFNASVVAAATPAMRISIGWLFIYGRFPVGQSGHVTAGALGTTMLMQHEKQANKDKVYVYFLGRDWFSDKIEVKVNNVLKETLTLVGQYAEVDDAGNVTPGMIGDNQARLEAVKAILEQLEKAGVNVSSPI